MEQIVYYGKDGAAEFVREFAAVGDVVLITGESSYRLSGAELFFDSVSPGLFARKLFVKSPNPKVGDVQALLDEMSDFHPKAFVAVGGGTAIDTAKLLNFAITQGVSVKEVLSLKSCPKLLPHLAVPTTAGTGAEATRFAVCYDGEVKHSIDFSEIRPSHALIIPEFSASLPLYQKLSTNFDAYAQAVESLWAKGATDESRRCAREALDYIAEGDWSRGSYWAGRAIDISRTTAAHAFSYYLTSHYGIPHGNAVYMVFEYILRNNAEGVDWLNGSKAECLSMEEIRAELEKFHKAGLKNLRELATEKGIEWESMVDALFSHVNLKRLGNNPVEVRKESFNV